MLCAPTERPCARVPIDASLLCQAIDSLQAGDVLSAGTRMREAIRRHLRALCGANGCTPRRNFAPVPHYARALRNAGLIGPELCERVLAAHRTGNAAAHCDPVAPDQVADALAALFALLDATAERPHSLL